MLEVSSEGLCLSTALSSDRLCNQTLLPAQATSLCSLIVLTVVKSSPGKNRQSALGS